MYTFSGRAFALISVSALALISMPAVAQAQVAPPASATVPPAASSKDDIVVTGVRASLRSAQAIKRSSATLPLLLIPLLLKISVSFPTILYLMRSSV